jgi:uncharacterized membrane protein
MIWLIILITIAGAALVKLGTLSVLVTVLAFSLKVVIGQERLGCDWERDLGREPE